METKVLSDLIGLLYDGLLYPDRWNDFLAQLCEQLCARVGTISVHDSEHDVSTLRASVGLSEDQLRDWIGYYGRNTPDIPEALRAVGQEGAWLNATPICELNPDCRNTPYGEWIERSDTYHAIIMLVSCGQGLSALSFARPESANRFSPSDENVMRQLLPHVQRAFEVRHRTEKLHSVLQAGKVALDSVDTGVVAVDEKGRMVLANERAESLLEKGRGITIRRGRLGASDPAEAARLEQLVYAAAMTGRGRGTSNGGAVAIREDEARAHLSVIVTPFRSSQVSAKGQPWALAFICDPEAKPAPRTTALRDLFGLTPAECRLAGLLHAGLELRKAADRMRVTPGTARFMLKSIFRKTGAHRQSQLIQLLSGLPGDSMPARGETKA